MANGQNGSAKKDEKVKLPPNEIVSSAYKYLQTSLLPTQRVADPRIEALEPVEQDKFWRVVISYDVIGELPFDKKREYKEFKVNAYVPGEVIWMKIYDRAKV